MHGRNKYDWYIIFIIASVALGNIQISILSQNIVVGLLLLPPVLVEIFRSIKQEKFKPIVQFLLFWFIYALFSVIWTRDSLHGFIDLYTLFFNIVICLAIYIYADRARYPVNSFMIGWITLIAITLPVALWEINTGQHLPWGNFNEDASENFFGEKSRIYAAVTFANLNTYVTLLCSALPIILSATCYVKHKLIPMLVAILSMIVILINASRGGLLCVVIDIVIFLMLYSKVQFKYKRLITLLLICCMTYLITNYIETILEQIILRTADSDSLLDGSSRWEVWASGMQLILKSLGFGYGVGAMDEVYITSGIYLGYAHNMVIEVMLQYGIIIAIILLYYFVKSFVGISRCTSIPLRIYAWSAMISFVPLMIIDNAYIVRPFFWAYFATLISIHKSQRKEPLLI